jgi:hypothetical protein
MAEKILLYLYTYDYNKPSSFPYHNLIYLGKKYQTVETYPNVGDFIVEVYPDGDPSETHLTNFIVIGRRFIFLPKLTIEDDENPDVQADPVPNLSELNETQRLKYVTEIYAVCGNDKGEGNPDLTYLNYLIEESKGEVFNDDYEA